MADKAGGIFDGAAGAEALVINATANEALKIGSPVIYVTAAAGEIFPRVAHPAANTEAMIGVVVGGDNNGIWDDGTLTNDGEAAAAAGEVVKVCISGRCKVRVDGAVAAIVINDKLEGADADGVARKAQLTGFAFAIALQASTADTDAILCQVYPMGIQT